LAQGVEQQTVNNRKEGNTNAKANAPASLEMQSMTHSSFVRDSLFMDDVSKPTTKTKDLLDDENHDEEDDDDGGSDDDNAMFDVYNDTTDPQAVDEEDEEEEVLTGPWGKEIV
jgi:hypothetical protein